MLKLLKVFQCSCIDGHTGDFCEHQTEHDHLLFVGKVWVPDLLNYNRIINNTLVFNADGRVIEENVVIDERAGVYDSCSAILNGEAIILGGFYPIIERQVHLK